MTPIDTPTATTPTATTLAAATLAATRTQRLKGCYTGVVQDALRSLGFPRQCLPTNIVALAEGMRLAGPVFTLSGGIDETATPHETLLAWTGFLSKAPSGSVVVCQPNDSSVSHMGELSAETLHSRGIGGYVVDGGCRDVDFIQRLGFPVFCRFRTPADIVARWLVQSMEQPIEIGGLTIHNGDYIVGDADGVIVIPLHLIDQVIETAETMMTTENLVRKAIREGVDPQEAYLRYGKF